MNRYKASISYNGKNYVGWQIQPNGISVQGEIEKCLSILLKEKISVVGAGRTDAGVHAKYFVLHFDSSQDIANLHSLAYKMNGFLDFDISIHKIKNANPEFHARFDAISRSYEYHLVQNKDPFRREFSMFHPKKLDFEKMNSAAKELLKYSDFTSFSKLHTDVHTNNCDVTNAFWEKQTEDFWIFKISANRFLRNMVRSIVGTLLDVGTGKTDIIQFKKIIEAKDRKLAGFSVPAQGLYLTDIQY